MATALVDLYGGEDFGPFDRIILAEGYRPSEARRVHVRQAPRLFPAQAQGVEGSDHRGIRARPWRSSRSNSLREPDLADRASSETDWSIELRTRDRQRKLIAKIDCAIRRLYEGEYGYCEVTGEPISLGRLEARPIATMTLEAQERHERIEARLARRLSGALARRRSSRRAQKRPPQWVRWPAISSFSLSFSFLRRWRRSSSGWVRCSSSSIRA